MNQKTVYLSACALLGWVLVAAPRVHAGVLSIPPSALLPRDNGIAYDSNGVRMAVPVVGELTFLAPVFLPDGVTITAVVLEAHDGSGGEFGGHVKMELVEMRYNTVRSLAALDTGIAAAPGDVRVSGVLHHAVDNSEFGYGISVVINNGAGGAWNQLFYKAVIYYEKDCVADFNLDGDVDGNDLATVSGELGRTDCR
ncbi:MAG: hypothetical protein Kow0092_32110 [Deferrisomatales bacterium]